MEATLSEVLGDLISRSVSLAIDRYCHRRDEGNVQENLQRLRRVLLRIQITVEEAERRRVTNQAMLQQLHLMRQAMYRGYYLLNAVMHQGKAREVSRHKHSSLASSEFNPTKRICLLPARTTTATTVVTAPYTGREAEAELPEVLINLERMAGDMKELVLFLGSYPPLVRQPYSRHLWLENRMFGREAEYERIIRFLLEPEPAGGRDLAVLPVIGRARIGKSTLVEHVWRDERVRKHFSLVVFFGESDIVGENLHLTPLGLGGRGVIKYHNDLASTTGSSLVVVELVGSVDESAWRRALSTLKSEGTTPVSKIIVTSRSEMVKSFGTMNALELKPLSREAYWYFFKTIAFGSTPDAEEQLGLASVCMEIADLLGRTFIGANIVAGLLRNNLCAGFWHRILKCVKDHTSMHLHLFGEDPIARAVKDQPIYIWRLFKRDSVLIAYICYEARSVQQTDLPKITVQDVHTGSTTPRGKFEALAWRSYIPPYATFVFRCGVQTSSSCLSLSRRNKQIRQRQARLTLI